MAHRSRRRNRADGQVATWGGGTEEQAQKLAQCVPVTNGDNAPLLPKGLNETTGLWKGDVLGKRQRAGPSPDVPHRLLFLQTRHWGGSEDRTDNVHGMRVRCGWKIHGSLSRERGLQAEPCNSER